MAAIVGELQPRNQLTVSVHACHALAGVIIIDSQCFVRARGGHIDATGIQAEFDQATLVRVGALKGFRLLGILCAIDAHIAILAGG